MVQTHVEVMLNQQQVELLDKTIERIGADDRESVLRTALREHGAELLAGSEESR